ncbi:hypothetical protein CTM62_05030 [Prevotella intermedia]|uniref:Uncharacterized protein n=1 Tax=Prevotella intermedia TaxID=28131 RepID=A0A2D3L6C6_PREIN|nr:hypothetical protein CTM62_05030 [Prevotella intermedia]
MHGKSGCFALQNLRFRNAKSKLSFFQRIIFTKPELFWSIYLEHEKENQISSVSIGFHIDNTVEHAFLRCVVIGRMTDGINFRF